MRTDTKELIDGNGFLYFVGVIDTFRLGILYSP